MEFVKKAILMVCLFSFPYVSFCQELRIEGAALTAYRAALNLEPVEYSTRNNSGEIYVTSFSDALSLLLSEDNKKLTAYEARFEARVQATGKSATELFVRAENHLQWAFVYLKFGKELDAAFQLRKAHQITRDLRKKHPDLKASLKTSGLLNIMLGSVPDKYNWILDILDMRGNVDAGLAELTELATSNHSLAHEAMLLKAFVMGFILQQPDQALKLLEETLTSPDNATLFLAANLAMKNSQAERGLKFIETIESRSEVVSIPYVLYLKGEMLLCKGEFSDAEKAFRTFLDNYAGQNYVKDAYFKIGVCRLLSGDESGSKLMFDQARSSGEEVTEADKHAARTLSDTESLSVPLTKVRYMTDGGYYEDAAVVLSTINPSSLTRQKDRIELPYRRARLYHKTGDLTSAIDSYKATIEIAGSAEYYFAPNACLQLGYHAMEHGKNEEAETYFRKALSYRKHEYKNSIDSKAKSALNHLKSRR